MIKYIMLKLMGFDELMAELFHEISNGEKLSLLGGSEKESKKR